MVIEEIGYAYGRWGSSKPNVSMDVGDRQAGCEHGGWGSNMMDVNMIKEH